MRSIAKPNLTFVGLTAILVALGTACDNSATRNGAMSTEPSGKDNRKETGRSHYLPPTAAEYAKLVEPELGVPPKVDVGAGVEIPIYVDGVKTKGFVGEDCDNPTLLKRGINRSGSVVQRYEGKTADGKPLPDVVWVAFARHAGVTLENRPLLGSVQMIGYHKKTGATAFFESSDAIEPWVSADPETERLVGVMPWIDEPDEFNKAYRFSNTQCVECHQNDPFIHSSFIDAAKLPGTDEPVIPVIAGDSPYYVIGGEDWDMRTIHIEGNGCFDCHRMATGTLRLFMSNGWDPNEHMPPDDPGSLKEDLQQLLTVWEKVPDELPPGVHWVIPPARGIDGRIVGDDYPYKKTRKILD
ncbi:MAG: hypothetical protein ISQ70_11080 [Pirellulales bacterium]|nr:hypothetical protein [Pirellulales bacterium]